MLFKPELPSNSHTPVAAPRAHEHAVCSCQHAPRRALPTVSTGAVITVLVGGVVLTALLAAVAVSAVAVAVAAVVLRSLLKDRTHQR
ncbi:SpdD protein [Streptomyces sp. CNQ-509]|uniref:SpdD protein n=1 Tax=Streptomyces sp. CNQ-509 TaxID=444103 RepID=UPI000AE46C88|nr:SpdD protein [Streptomyces sp. CNQ-509]